MKDYKKTVAAIKNLPWEKLSSSELQALMIVSAYAAREFAESLRISLQIHPESPELQEMAAGELNTSNLAFADYNKAGDHADFLWHFIHEYGLASLYPEAHKAGETYLAKVRMLPRELRAMSIMSREEELSGIFKRILEAKDWSLPVLRVFRYYLVTHIQLDSAEGGHAELLSGFPVTNEVAAFYKIRLDLYRCIPTLFS